MRPLFQAVSVALVVTVASHAQAQVHISAGAEVLSLTGGPSIGDGDGGTLTPPATHAIPASAIGNFGTFAQAYVEGTVTQSTVTASGTANSATSSLDLRTANAVSNLIHDFTIVGFMQLVYSYQLHSPATSAFADYEQRIAFFSLDGFHSGDPTPFSYIDAAVHGMPPSQTASGSGVLPLYDGDYYLFAGAESRTLFLAGPQPVPTSATPSDLTWELSLQFLDGQNQASAFLPTSIGQNGEWVFANMPGGFWYDPVPADGFAFEMLTEGSSFTEAGMPVGLGDPGHVYTLTYMDGEILVSVPVLEGTTYDAFPAGVTSFKVLNIPLFDPDDPLAFPVFLDFSTPTADFTMTPILIPEPATFALLALGGMVVIMRRGGGHRTAGQRRTSPPPAVAA